MCDIRVNIRRNANDLRKIGCIDFKQIKKQTIKY